MDRPEAPKPIAKQWVKRPPQAHCIPEAKQAFGPQYKHIPIAWPTNKSGLNDEVHALET